MKELKDQIRQQISLSSLIGEDVALKKSGNFTTGLCPFHEENTASFYVYTDHYHCFGCGAHGDAISYVRNTKGMSFVAALKWLAEKYNLRSAGLEMDSTALKAWQSERRQRAILAEAQALFTKNIAADGGSNLACRYLRQRGISLEQAKDFGLGYAPPSQDLLLAHFRNLAFSENELFASSIIQRGESRCYDFFKNRLLFPVHDEYGRLIAFSGRALGKDQVPKYKNSRFDKSATLLGLHRAKATILRTKRVIIVEGHFDWLQMALHGFTETLACQGTAISLNHLRILQKFAKSVILLFDGDKAGIDAAMRVVDLSFKCPTLHFSVAFLPQNEDPDSWLRKMGREAMAATLSEAKDLLSFAIKNKMANAPSNGVAEVIRKDIAPWIKTIADPLQRATILKTTAELAGLDWRFLASHLKGNQQSSQVARQAEVLEPEQTVQENLAPDGLEQEFLAQTYFCSPDSSELDLIESLAKEAVELSEVWERWTQELLASLKGGNTPATLPIDAWQSSKLPHFCEFLGAIRAKKEAFRHKHVFPFERLKYEFARRNLTRRLQDLKRQTVSFHSSGMELGSEYGLQLTKGLAQATKDLENAERKLRNLLQSR